MISARDIHWDELEDAYGKAGHIPDLLNEAFKDKASKIDTQSGPWFDLWSRLFHQGSVYTASYAAVPMIVEAIKKADGPIAMDYFLLPVSIELARHENDAPALPQDLAADYLSAIRELGDMAAKYTDADDLHLKKAAEAARLVSVGQIDQASELIDAYVDRPRTPCPISPTSPSVPPRRNSSAHRSTFSFSEAWKRLAPVIRLAVTKEALSYRNR